MRCAGEWRAVAEGDKTGSGKRWRPWPLPEQLCGSNYGLFDQIVGTLPEGFSYAGSHLSEAAVVVEGQTVAFTLLGDERFTYAVAASRAEGSYSFSGVLLAEAEG